MLKDTRPFLDSLENNFYGFWIKNFRISLLCIILLVFYGIYSLLVIPKESTPDIKFGIVSVTTVYPGANPIDVDDLVTTEIEDKIKELQWIDAIQSSSSVGFSQITITLENETNTKDFIASVQQEINKVQLPTEATDPAVAEISTDNEVLFQMMLYASSSVFDQENFRTLANDFARNIKGKWPIVDVTIAGQSSTSEYDVAVVVNPIKLEQLDISASSIAQAIRSYGQSVPLGNYAIGDSRYDFRISSSLQSLQDLMQVPIITPRGSIFLQDIASIERDYVSDAVILGWIYGSSGNHAVELTIFKPQRSDVFSDSDAARSIITSELQKKVYAGISYAYTQDIAEVIVDDYSSLATNGLQSLLFIFLIMRFFVWFKQSIIASFAMLLSFFVTFIFLNTYWYTLNFLTNFSLVLTFGMGIDTVIVIIEAAYEYMKKGFDSKTAVLLAMKNYAWPNISSSIANMIVFIPLLLLPGVTGKFLAYIPITIFVTLLASLFLASSINSALFWKLNKNFSFYYVDDPASDQDEELLISEDEMSVLEQERKGKIALPHTSQPRTDVFIAGIAHKYTSWLHRIVVSVKARRIVIFGPLIALVLTFVFLSPRIWFSLFPSGDNPFVLYQIQGDDWSTTESMQVILPDVDDVLSDIPEIKAYTITALNNSVDISIILFAKADRQRDSFAIEDEIKQRFTYLQQQGYRVEGKVQAWGPPVGKAIGIQLIAQDASQLSVLREVSQDFETYIRTLTGAINISNSSPATPGQFQFTLNKNKLSALGLTPSDVQNDIAPALLGIDAGTIAIDQEDRDIVVRYPFLGSRLSPDQLMSTMISTRQWSISLGDVADYTLDPWLSTITRDEWDITVRVDADLEQWIPATALQPLIISYAETYPFPEGISFKAGWENEANSDLIQATMMAFFIAIFLTFLVLVYQFNSFSQPAIILYSIVLALLGVNVWLFVTGNPYSMSFAIWFISLIGLVVNNAIFLIDKINRNLQLWAELLHAVLDAGATRFKPIVISSLTAVLGIISLAFQDEFWAWLAWTVVFGLLFSAFMTLISVPSIYYAVYQHKAPKTYVWKERVRSFVKRGYDWLFIRVQPVYNKIIDRIGL